MTKKLWHLPRCNVAFDWAKLYKTWGAQCPAARFANPIEQARPIKAKHACTEPH